MTADTTNEGRANRAQAVLQQYVQAKGDRFESNSSEIADLIADLLHLRARLDQGHRPIENTLRMARLHFEAEHNNPEEMGGVIRRLPSR